MEYTSEKLLEGIRIRASLPVSQATFSDGELLGLADDEVSTTLVPLILAANEDYLVTARDFPVAPVRIPSRAIGAKLRSVCLVDSSGREAPLPRVRPEHNPEFGFYVSSGFVFPVNKAGTSYSTMRLRYYGRPASLVKTSEVGIITGINLAAGEVTIDPVPEGFASGGSFDVVRGSPPFDTLVHEQVGQLAGGVVTFPSALPDSVEAGDLVCRAGEASVVQLPAEWFPVLAQLVAVRCLASIGDVVGATEAAKEAGRLQKAALGLVSNRVDDAPEVVVPSMFSPWRSR